MKAITVKQPWAWAIAHGDKDIENRGNNLRCVPLGRIIAIHAGKGKDAEGFVSLCKTMAETGNLESVPAVEFTTGIIGLARFGGNVVEHDSPYFTGPIGWVLDERNPLTKPLPINGKQGPWELDNALLLRHLGLQWNQTKMDQWQLSRKANGYVVAELNLVVNSWQPRILSSNPNIGHYSGKSIDYRTARKWAEEEACLQWCGQVVEEVTNA